MAFLPLFLCMEWRYGTIFYWFVGYVTDVRATTRRDAFTSAPATIGGYVDGESFGEAFVPAGGEGRGFGSQTGEMESDFLTVA